MAIERACNLPDGYWQVPSGKIANSTIWLEMTSRPALDVVPLVLARVPAVNSAAVREVFNRIGAPWLWDRTIELNADGSADVWGPDDFLYYAHGESGQHVGLIELRRAKLPDESLEIEVVYLGLFPEVTGRGLGKRLMAAALNAAWSFEPKRVHVHTCNFDHPSALPLYIASGFKPCALGFQIMDDPRLQGLLPRESAPHIPLITIQNT